MIDQLSVPPPPKGVQCVEDCPESWFHEIANHTTYVTKWLPSSVSSEEEEDPYQILSDAGIDFEIPRKCPHKSQNEQKSSKKYSFWDDEGVSLQKRCNLCDFGQFLVEESNLSSKAPEMQKYKTTSEMLSSLVRDIKHRIKLLPNAHSSQKDWYCGKCKSQKDACDCVCVIM